MTEEPTAPVEPGGSEHIESPQAETKPEPAPVYEPVERKPKPENNSEGFYSRQLEKAERAIAALEAEKQRIAAQAAKEKQEMAESVEQITNEALKEIQGVKAETAEIKRAATRDKLMIRAGLDPDTHGEFVYAADQDGMKAQIERLLVLAGKAKEEPRPEPQPEPQKEAAKPEAPQATPGEERPKPAAETATNLASMKGAELKEWALKKMLEAKKN